MNTLFKSMMIGTMTLLVIGTAYGQRGRGETEGLARQGAQPEIVELKGTLSKIETGPCGRTTGRAYIGTHLFIEQEDGTLINLHVGSAEAVKPFVDTLEIGQPIEAAAFRTELLEENHYVAQTIHFGDETLNVRREDLSPFWAQQRRDRRSDRGDGRGDRDRRQDRMERQEQRRSSER